MPEPEIKDGGIWICHTCKTVIGPIIDDDKNKCGCDVYEFEYSRYIPDRADLAKPSEWISVTANCDECGNRVEAKFKISKIISLEKGASIHGICSKCGKLPISLETTPTR